MAGGRRDPQICCGRGWDEKGVRKGKDGKGREGGMSRRRKKRGAEAKEAADAL